MVSGLTFISLIHFEFIFVYGVRKCSSFILLQVVDQFSTSVVSFLTPEVYTIKSQTAYREKLIIALYLSLSLEANEFNQSFLIIFG